MGDFQKGRKPLVRAHVQPQREPALFQTTGGADYMIHKIQTKVLHHQDATEIFLTTCQIYKIAFQAVVLALAQMLEAIHQKFWPDSQVALNVLLISHVAAPLIVAVAWAQDQDLALQHSAVQTLTLTKALTAAAMDQCSLEHHQCLMLEVEVSWDLAKGHPGFRFIP